MLSRVITLRHLVLMLVLCSIAAPLRAASYSYVNISRNIVGYNLGAAAINQSGTIAFPLVGPNPDDTKWQALYLGRGGPPQKLASRTGWAARQNSWDPDINRNGAVSYWSYTDDPGDGDFDEAALFTASAKGVNTVARYENAFFTQDAAINDKGQIVTVIKWNATDATSVVTYSPKRTVATFKNPANIFGQPDINNFGAVVYPVKVGAEERIIANVGGKQHTIATTKGTNFASLLDSTPVINDLGEIAFHATLRSPGINGYQGEGIYLFSRDGLRTIVENTSIFERFGGFSINNRGQVVFMAFRAPGFGDEGIFAGPDPLADCVICDGDLLNGETVLSLNLASHALNDAGQVAFHAYLTAGRESVFRADPISLATAAAVPTAAAPEPSTLLLLGIACAPFLLARWRLRAASCV